MNPPTVTVALRWRPEALLTLARDYDDAARRLVGYVDGVVVGADRSADHWTGAAAESARERARRIGDDAAAVARRLVAASVAAHDAAAQLARARDDVLEHVHQAQREGFDVADDGSVIAPADPDPVLVLLAGGAEAAAGDMLEIRAAALTDLIRNSLERLGAADADAADDITAAMGTTGPVEHAEPVATVPASARPAPASEAVVAGWPTTGQAGIANQIAAMSPEQRLRLVADFPHQVGNTDGVPWETRIAANRLNIAEAILAESGADPGSRGRIAFYRSLLGEIDDPVTGQRVPRKIIAFDPDSASLVELNGDLATARGVAVLVPGVNTTIEGSAANTATARRFVSAAGGDVAVITYLGGAFPQVHNPVAVVSNAADPRYALDMAPRLVAFTEDVDRRVADGVAVTVIGHSYGGSIVGTAETLGLTSDRTLFLGAAGAGVGVDDAGDWHNRNPDVLRFSMTAPDDFIELVQGIPGGPHGVDPDEIAGVIALPTGNYDDGEPVYGWEAHSGMLNRPGDSWRTILAIIAGDSPLVRAAG